VAAANLLELVGLLDSLVVQAVAEVVETDLLALEILHQLHLVKVIMVQRRSLEFVLVVAVALVALVYKQVVHHRQVVVQEPPHHIQERQ
jgi:hypothetical protein